VEDQCEFCADVRSDVCVMCIDCLERRAAIIGRALHLAKKYPEDPESKEINSLWGEVERITDIAEALITGSN
jgi:hypothetical protein